MKKLLVNYMDYYEFDKLVNNEFFKGLQNKYEFVCEEELNNDIAKLYHNIDGTFDSYDEDYLKEFLDGKMMYKANIILEELCRRGLIDPGDYLINVSW